MEEEMMQKIMGFSSFGNPKLIGQDDDQVVEESPPSHSHYASQRRRNPEAGIDEDRRRHRRRRSRERDDRRSRSVDRKKKKRSRSREKKKSDRDRSRDHSRGKKPRSRSPKTRSNRERRRDRNENSSTASKYLHDDRKSKIEDDVKNENYSEKVSNHEVQEKANVFEDRNENFSTASKYLHDADRKFKIEDDVKNENYSEKVSKNEVQEKANVFEDRNENFSTASWYIHADDRKSKIEDDVKNENYSEKICNNEVQEDANVLAFIPEEKDVFGQQIVKDMIENILARVFRNTREKFHGEMAKYFSTAISKICNLKYQEAKSVADQMVDVVEITFPDVRLNLQEPFEMAKLKENNSGGDPYLMEFRRELHHKLRSANVKKANFRFSEIVDLTVNYLGQM